MATQAVEWRAVSGAPLGAGDASPFRRLLGPGWAALPAAVRRRFDRHVAAGACVTYVGQVTECRISGVGRLLAHAARVIGAPLPLSRDTGVAAAVSVTGDTEGREQYWTRQYSRRHGFPQVIRSAKRFAGPTGLEEYLGFGLGIALRLRVAGGALLFESDHYFVRLAGATLRIPRWIAPGALTVGHVDLGEGRFAFTLDLVHPQFGELVHQVAIFADMRGAAA